MPNAVVIHLEPAAPRKPDKGQPCNGCGVCCALEPCPLGVVLSRRLRGRCDALTWDAPASRYRCGALKGSRLARGVVSRWIAAGSGCDADLQIG